MKRNEYLKPISRDHHYGLLLCWKIREGLKKGIEVERIKKYADWFFQSHLIPHFAVEEKYIFPILGNKNKNIIRALAEHRKLEELFQSGSDLKENLSKIEKELDNHIRFEERILFNEIQNAATEEQLKQIQISHSDGKFEDNFSDPFWGT